MQYKRATGDRLGANRRISRFGQLQVQLLGSQKFLIGKVLPGQPELDWSDPIKLSETLH